jgi:hypothetical protein
MIRTLPLAATALLLAGTVSAQPPGPPPRGGFDIERMAVLLDLDDYQKTEVERILNEQRDARAAMRQQRADGGERPSREEMEAHRSQMRDGMLMQLQSVLNQTQLEKFEALMTPPERGRREHRRGESE